MCFSDGTEAIVGVKAEIEKSDEVRDVDDTEGTANTSSSRATRARGDWLEMAIEIPGQRDDEASKAFLAEMLREALLADREFSKRLYINRRFHWRLFLDVRSLQFEILDPAVRFVWTFLF